MQRKKDELAKRNKNLEELAERKHELTTTLDNAKKVEELQEEEVAITSQLEEMNKGWAEIKQQLELEIEKKKKVVSEKKIEYTYKADQIKQMKKEISDSLREMRNKEELIKFLEEEYSKTPKGKRLRSKI